ncbi:hypothetical protein ACOSP7_023416 [Xanthoceras sorbifolium]
MEISSFKWIPELETDYSSFFHQYQMDPLDYSLDGINFQSFSSETTQKESASSIEASHISVERPAKQLETSSWNSCTTEHLTPKTSPSSSTKIISFKNSTSFPDIPQPGYGLDLYSKRPKTEAGSPENIKFPYFASLGSNQQETKRAASTTRNPLQARDHIIAERNRRESLSQRFIALSALLPGLKKMDKASVLEDAIKYLKRLEGRVKSLEEKAAKKTMESMVIVNKSNIFSCHETSSSDDNFDSKSNSLYLPQVRVRVSGRDVLIRIHCQNYKRCTLNILNEIEKLHLIVVNSNVLPFGTSALDITVVAQMDIEFAITEKDLVKKLRLAILKFFM